MYLFVCKGFIYFLCILFTTCSKITIIKKPESLEKQCKVKYLQLLQHLGISNNTLLGKKVLCQQLRLPSFEHSSSYQNYSTRLSYIVKNLLFCFNIFEVNIYCTKPIDPKYF